jgi:predicted metal-dependent peptidase
VEGERFARKESLHPSEVWHIGCSTQLPTHIPRWTCVAIDTSGSISDEDCRVFLSEVAGILSQFESYEMRIWCFDTKVYNAQIFTSESCEEIEGYGMIGGGGTSFDCNWNYMKLEGIVPDRFIMFTDGYTGDGWGDAEYCETLFVMRTNPGDGGDYPVAPHGTTVAFEG